MIGSIIIDVKKRLIFVVECRFIVCCNNIGDVDWVIVLVMIFMIVFINCLSVFKKIVIGNIKIYWVYNN